MTLPNAIKAVGEVTVVIENRLKQLKIRTVYLQLRYVKGFFRFS